MSIYIKPFPDESLYSIISRYAILSGISSRYCLCNSLIEKDINNGRVTSRDTIRLIRVFSKLTETSLDDFINNHTLLSLYKPFSYVNCKQSSIRLINSAFNIKGESSSVRLCEECYLNDIRTYGVAYWHRSHSVPYVDFCHIHKTRLRERKILGMEKNGILYLPSINMIDSKYNYESYTSDIYNINVSEFSHELLKSDTTLIGIEELTCRCVYDLESRGIINNLNDILNNQDKPVATTLSSKDYFIRLSINMLKRLITFLHAKKISIKSIIDFLLQYSECIHFYYNTFDNMFKLCRDFSMHDCSTKYIKQIRQVREEYAKKRISTQFSVHNLCEAW